MIRLVVSNQRGGVAKTTTAVTLSLLLAERGKRVLLIDTDPQSSVHSVLGFKPAHDLYDAIINKLVFADCLHEIKPNLWVLPSTRKTGEAEDIIYAQTARELTFVHFFGRLEQNYDAVIIDTAPSISLLQSCALMYCKQALVPVAMEPLSLQGAIASLQGISTLNDIYQPAEPLRVLGFLPVNVNRRLAITATVSDALSVASERSTVPILPAIRTDQDVVRAMRDRTPITDAYPNCKALEDYRTALDAILPLCEGRNEQVTSAA
jgi:chromosome partitioning protein